MSGYFSKKNKLKKNLVLDLDETLVHSFVNSNDNYEYSYKKNPKIFSSLYRSNQIYNFDFDKYGNYQNQNYDESMWLVKRPSTDEFLNYIDKNFEKVIIWSAGRTDYVNEIVDFLFKDIPKYPFDVLTYDNLSVHKLKNMEYYTKPLTKIFRKHSDLNLTNTLIVDNIEHNYIYTNRYNGITIPHYNPSVDDIVSEKIFDDECLLDMMYWFDGDHFTLEEDVRYIDKKEIFPSHLKKEFQPSPKKLLKNKK